MDAAIRSMMTSDPAGVLRKSDGDRTTAPRNESHDPEPPGSDDGPGQPEPRGGGGQSNRATDETRTALVAVADALPDEMRDRKLDLLDQAARDAKAADTRPAMRLFLSGGVAERWFELGKKAEAKALFAECAGLANTAVDKTDTSRGTFAAQLARVDLPSALAIVKDFSTSGATLQNSGAPKYRFPLGRGKSGRSRKGVETGPPAARPRMAPAGNSLEDGKNRPGSRPKLWLTSRSDFLTSRRRISSSPSV